MRNFFQKICAFNSVKLSDRKASRWHGWRYVSTVFHIASVWEPRPVYQRRQVTPPVHEYGRPYKTQIGTYCLTIWKVLQSTWLTCTKKSSCLAKSIAQEETSQYPLRLTSADTPEDIANMYTCYLMFDTRPFDIQTLWRWSHRDRNM